MKPTLILFLMLAPVSAATISTFDSNAEAWLAVTANPTISGFPVGNASVPLNWDAGGFARVADVDNLDTFFVAPAAFLGNRLSALNTSLKFDLFAFNQPNYAGALVVAKGGGLTLAYTAPSQTLVQNVWVSESVPLGPGGNWRVGTLNGSLATAADFQTVFADLTALWLSAENVGGVVETTGLDNVRLDDTGGPVSAVPEPNAGLSMATGLVLCASIRAARRRPQPPAERP